MPVCLTALLTLVPPISVLAGVWISQRGTERVARQTLEGQKILASDAERRDWRRQQVVPYIEAVKQRMHFWTELLSALADHEAYLLLPDEQKPAMLTEETKYQALVRQVFDPHFNSFVGSFREIPDIGFKEAFGEVVTIEIGVKSPPFTKDELMGGIMNYGESQVELNAAAERYIFSADRNGEGTSARLSSPKNT